MLREIPRLFLTFVIFLSATCSGNITENKNAGLGSENISAITQSTDFDQFWLISEGNLTPEKTKELVEKYPTIKPIDVQTLKEYEKYHLKNSIHIDFLNSEFEEKIKELDKNMPYIVYCYSGGRSKRALSNMREWGFNKTAQMAGGIIMWQKSGYSVEGSE